MKHNLRIALVEDDLDLLHSTQEFLTELGFQVWGVPSAEGFFRRFSVDPVDVVVLDIGLPGEDGLSVTTLLRTNRNLAIIILSARDSLDDRLAGLRAGADRYLVKPVNLMELAANIEAVHNRLTPTGGEATLTLPRTPNAVVTHPAGSTDARWVLTFGEWLITAPNGNSMELSSREFVLIHKLVIGYGQVVPRKELINTVFGTRHTNGDDRFNVMLTRLRKKIARTLHAELPIKTAHLIGYAFVGQALLIGV